MPTAHPIVFLTETRSHEHPPFLCHRIPVLGPNKFVDGIGEMGGLLRQNSRRRFLAPFVLFEDVSAINHPGIVHRDHRVAAAVAVDPETYGAALALRKDFLPQQVFVAHGRLSETMHLGHHRPTFSPKDFNSLVVVRF